jgi:hypothetical protein
MALLLLRFASNVGIDIGDGEEGKHPDLTFEFDGLKWAIECKTPGSGKVKTFKDKVLEGVKQIDEFKTPIDRGFVALNMRNAIMHDDFWPIALNKENGELIPIFWRNFHLAYDKLDTYRPSNQAIKEDFGGSEALNVVSQWNRARPFVLTLYNSTANVLDDQGNERIGYFRTFDAIEFSASDPNFKKMDSLDTKLLKQLQEALHDKI